jgi:hypothetical protein
MGQGRLVERKARDVVLLSSRLQIFIGGHQKRQLPELMLRKRLPDGYDTQEDFVCFVLNRLGGGRGKPRIVRDVP